MTHSRRSETELLALTAGTVPGDRGVWMLPSERRPSATQRAPTLDGGLAPWERGD